MYPGPEDPDLGVFVQQLEQELRRRGNELELAVLDRRAGGKRRHAQLARKAIAAARRFKPDVVYAHFLVPTGLVGALGVTRAARRHRPRTRRPERRLDPRGPRRDPPRRRDGRARSSPSRTTCAPSSRRRCPKLAARSRSWTAVSTSSASPSPPRRRADGVPLRRRADRAEERPAPRRRVRPARRGLSTFVGDGPLRRDLEGRVGVAVTGAVAHDEVPDWLARSRRALPAEPRGAVRPRAPRGDGRRALGGGDEGGRAAGVRHPRGRRAGRPDRRGRSPADCRRAAALPCPNPAARAAAEEHDVKRQAERVEEILRRAARGRPDGARSAVGRSPRGPLPSRCSAPARSWPAPSPGRPPV